MWGSANYEEDVMGINPWTSLRCIDTRGWQGAAKEPGWMTG
jgi:hypothetical protein